jgi:SAM-dependent methyltransferase
MRRRGGSEKSKGTRSLDVGCGGGMVVRAFQKVGWEAIGIDLSMKAISAGKNKGLDLRAVSIEDQTLGKFDLISAFHILEHIHSPKQFLHRCAERLVQGGYLLVEVPDYGSRRALRMGKNWPYLYPSTHLYQFATETLTNYLLRAKFGIIKIRKVYGKGPLENSSSQAGYKSRWHSRFKNSLFELRHLLYWSPITRQLLRYLYWHVLGYGECIRILAQKGC